MCLAKQVCQFRLSLSGGLSGGPGVPARATVCCGVFCKERNACLKTQNGMAGGSPVLCFSEFHTLPVDGAFLFLLAFKAPVAVTRRSDGWGAQTLTWGVSPCGVSSPIGSQPETQRRARFAWTSRRKRGCGRSRRPAGARLASGPGRAAGAREGPSRGHLIFCVSKCLLVAFWMTEVERLEPGEFFDIC